MRCLPLLASLIHAASCYRDLSKVDTDWATHPDLTADWFTQNGQPLPELAPPITTVEANKSYVVKLECLGCPFRVRTTYQVQEEWQDPPQENSLLLNFTIDTSGSSLLLNGDRIARLAPMPLSITAFQTNANLSMSHMDKMTSLQMLDRGWTLGTKYGTFELQYEHSLVGMRTKGQMWIQFDIQGIHYRSSRNPGSYQLRQDGQKMVQVLLHENSEGGTQELHIKDIQIVDRKDRAQPFVMDCGKLAIVQTMFNPLEWDYYGQFGTWQRAWHLWLWTTGSFIDRNGGILILFALVAGIVSVARWRARRLQLKAAVRAEDDAEAALLEPELDDAPPEYDDAEVVDDKDEKV